MFQFWNKDFKKVPTRMKLFLVLGPLFSSLWLFLCSALWDFIPSITTQHYPQQLLVTYCELLNETDFDFSFSWYQMALQSWILEMKLSFYSWNMSNKGMQVICAWNIHGLVWSLTQESLSRWKKWWDNSLWALPWTSGFFFFSLLNALSFCLNRLSL